MYEFDLSEIKEYRKRIEIIFDVEGKLDTDEILGALDDLIQQVDWYHKQYGPITDIINSRNFQEMMDGKQ